MDTLDMIIAALRRIGYDSWAAKAAALGELAWIEREEVCQ